MIAAILGMLGFAVLFALAGLVPLEKRSCEGSCSAESAADCAGCPFGPGAVEEPDGLATSSPVPSDAPPGRRSRR